jgi:hypothetical protein
VNTNAVVFQGALTLRQDVGYETSPLPYQQVYVADFSSFTTPGEYQIQVEGMGASLPFLINDGIAMAWARTYALGMYEQRSGGRGPPVHALRPRRGPHRAGLGAGPGHELRAVRLHLELHQGLPPGHREQPQPSSRRRRRA